LTPANKSYFIEDIWYNY